MSGRPISLKRRHLTERTFHDQWARTLAVEDVRPFQAFESPTAIENQIALKALGPLKGKRILDLGCGMGDASIYFAKRGAHVTSADISPGMVALVKKLATRYHVRNRLRGVVAVGEKLPFKDKSFDLVYGNGVLHHLDLSRAPKEIRRVMKPGARALFIEPLAYNPIIHLYRKMAKAVRTEAEAPLRYRDFRKIAAHFSDWKKTEVQFLTLLVFLWFFLVERANPSKVRYWKKIVDEGERYGRAFSALRKTEAVLLRFLPFLRPFCWNIVLCFTR